METKRQTENYHHTKGENETLANKPLPSLEEWLGTTEKMGEGARCLQRATKTEQNQDKKDDTRKIAMDRLEEAEEKEEEKEIGSSDTQKFQTVVKMQRKQTATERQAPTKQHKNKQKRNQNNKQKVTTTKHSNKTQDQNTETKTQ
eukprot:GILI01032260.1.p2 GENE.GILI01032260.1~~GILI01032260.1.p2  ORF type:complete len:145 (-),score=9.86 GILI01032260.1:76-510(-)